MSFSKYAQSHEKDACSISIPPPLHQSEPAASKSSVHSSFSRPSPLISSHPESINTNPGIHYAKGEELSARIVGTSYFPDKGTLIEIRQNGETVQVTRPYGIGIDTHKKFLSITLIVNCQLQYVRFQQDFPTTSDGIHHAKEWAIELINAYCNPPVSEDEPFHYSIESTATLHYPVLKIWGGVPSVVNPVLAKAGRRKTDRIDSAQLANADVSNYWPSSFVPDDNVNELRVLVNERDYYSRLATKVNNRIGNSLARFGYTISREGSVTRNNEIRGIIEKIIAEEPVIPDYFHMDPIPSETRMMLREDYKLYDQFNQRSSEYKAKMLNKARSMSWETGEGFISGSDMIDLLTTAPQVGEVTAVVWLANIVTPKRFHNAKALAAYCGLDPSIKTSAGKKTSDKKRGGNIVLHKTLCSCGNRLISFPYEMFGRWGHSLVKKGTSRNRARNAVARKLAVALYYMMMYNKPFSYEKYGLPQEMILLDIPLNDFAKMEPGFRRYIHILEELGITTTGELIRQYVTCKLDDIDGLGRKFFTITRGFIDNQHDYRDKWEALTNEAVRSDN